MTPARILPFALFGVLALPGAAAQIHEFKLLADNGSQGDHFGACVAVEGDTAIVGAPLANSHAGSVYVFERKLPGINAWEQVGELTHPEHNGGDRFGSSVALSGDVAVVGAPQEPLNGAVHVFERDSAGNWVYGLELTPTPLEGRFGVAVAIDGDTITVGRTDAIDGAVHVFDRDWGGMDAWGESTVLFSNSGQNSDNFGFTVGIEGDAIAVGASGIFGPGGRVYVFERDLGGPNKWGESAVLASSELEPSALFGYSVSLSQDMLAVGAPSDDHPGMTDCGCAYVFERNAGGANAWGEVAKLIASDPDEGDYFGWSVGLSGATLAIGAWRDDHSFTPNAGAAYVFKRTAGGAWMEAHKLVASDPTAGSEFGTAVAASIETVLVGAPKNNEAPGTWSGATYAYWLLEPTGTSYCTAGLSASGCQAAITANGTASSTASSGFFVVATQVEGAKDGMFFYGANGRQAVPWGTGYQCVVPPVKRGGLMPGIGTANACDGAFSQGINALWCPTCPKPQHNPGAGATVQAQLWYRDPWNTATTKGTTMSDAIEFVVGP